MTYLNLFLVFLKIGAVSFGGGYGMIPLMREESLNNGWLTESEFLDFIAVSESTPGPLAVNMATFIGSAQGGIFGALCATVGVVLPAFIIILLIAAILKNILKYRGVQAVLGGIRAATAGLVTSTALIMLLETIFSLSTVESSFYFDLKGAVIFGIIALSAIIFRHIKKKKISPIALILFSAVLGVLFYSFG